MSIPAASSLPLDSLIVPTPGGIASRILAKAAGGSLTQSFQTVSLSPVLGTKLVGKVVDPGVDLLPPTQAVHPTRVRRGARDAKKGQLEAPVRRLKTIFKSS